MDLNSATIREIRIDRGWTQQQFADISSLSLRTIQRVESQGLGSLETSKSLAAAFEIERDILLIKNTTIVESASLPQAVNIYFLLFSFVLGALIGALVLWLLVL